MQWNHQEVIEKHAGAQALAAVTLMFPLYMLIVSLATLVSSGMSSCLAREIGAGQMAGARATYASAHGMARPGN